MADLLTEQSIAAMRKAIDRPQPVIDEILLHAVVQSEGFLPRSGRSNSLRVSLIRLLDVAEKRYKKPSLYLPFLRALLLERVDAVAGRKAVSAVMETIRQSGDFDLLERSVLTVTFRRVFSDRENQLS